MNTSMKRLLADLRREMTSAVIQARGRDWLLVIHGYCECPDCPAREVDIDVKDRDDNLLALIDRRGLRCPICGRPLACFDVRTFAEQKVEDDRWARCSVNVQCYERDYGPGFCLTVLFDDRLPPAEGTDDRF
jgi:hypothetical protein